MHNSTHNINIISLSQNLKCEVERERCNLRYCSGTLMGGERTDQKHWAFSRYFNAEQKLSNINENWNHSTTTTFTSGV
jgi:hypothetical protein